MSVGKRKGHLLVIGGNERKEAGEQQFILQAAAQEALAQQGRLVVLTVATELPEETALTYRTAFGNLGVKDLEVLDIRTRDQAYRPESLRKLDSASVLFFTGGDQLRITSQMGGTPVMERIFEMHEAGAAIVGTSAGAAAMSGTMLVGGPGGESNLGGIAMAPGLGLLRGCIVDSHFAQRSRFGRLLGAVAQNPRNLGIGIDEDTAIHVVDDAQFTVLGSGTVFVFDGTSTSYTNLSETASARHLTVHDARVHVLGPGARFDLTTRRPLPT